MKGKIKKQSLLTKKNISQANDYELVYTDDPRQIEILRSSSVEEVLVDPKSTILKIRLEKQHRGGKLVTVIFNLPHNRTYCHQLAKKLKNQCGTGGTLKNDQIELQGDQRDKVKNLLEKLGFTVQ